MMLALRAQFAAGGARGKCVNNNYTKKSAAPDEADRPRSIPLRFRVMLFLLTLYVLPLGLVMYIQHTHMSRVVHGLTEQRLAASLDVRVAVLKEKLSSLVAYAEALASNPSVRRLAGQGSSAAHAVEQLKLNVSGDVHLLRRLEVISPKRRAVLVDSPRINEKLIRLKQPAADGGSFVSGLGGAEAGLLTEVTTPMRDATGQAAVLRMTVEGKLPPSVLQSPAALGASGRIVLAAMDETNTPRSVTTGGTVTDRDLWRMPIWQGSPADGGNWINADVQGRASFVSWSAIPAYGLTSLAIIDRAEVNAETDRVAFVSAAILLIAGIGFLVAVWRYVLKRLTGLERGIAAEALRVFEYQPTHGDEVLSLSQLFRKILDEHQLQSEETQRQFTRVSELLKQREADIDDARTVNSLMERELARVARFVELGEVAATVAHDINQPLTQMRLMIEASSLDPANQGGASLSAADVGKTQVLIRKITDITVNLRDLARDRAQSKKEVMKASQIAADALLLARVRVKSSLANVELAGDDRVLCAVDPVKIQQVLMNLVVNASDAFDGKGAPDGRRIRVLWRELSGRVYFMIEDNGSGIPDEIKPKIFEWNFSTKGADKGSGLGLAICRRIVEAHGGKIDVGDRPGGGAVFSFDVEAGAAASS